MTQFQFTIIDYTVNPAGDSTVIDEPVGWDGLTMKLSRHKDWHGFFDYFDAAISMLEFDGDGFVILKAAYETLGVDAKVELLIEYRCSETDAFEEIYTGNFDFVTYERICSDRCYIKINVETTSCLVQLKNRYDQKVNVESLRTFDLPDADADDLAAYTGIGFDMEMLAQEIFLRTNYQITDGTTFYFTSGGGARVGEVWSYFFNFFLDLPGEQTLPSFVGLTSEYDVHNSTPPSPIENYIANGYPIFELFELSKLACYGTFDITVHVKGNYTESTADDRDYGARFNLLRVVPSGAFTTLDLEEITAYNNFNGGVPHNENFDATLTANTALNEGDKIYFCLFLFDYQYLTGSGGGSGTDPDPFSLAIEYNIFDFEISGLALCENTYGKVSLINETASRVAEIITGECLKVYSDYYGRTDAEPYTSVANGCGGYRVLTSGLFIRRALQTDNTPTLHNLSMKDIFEGLNAIDCIGMGVEDDPNRPGYQWLRIERMQYFYDTTVLLTLLNIAKVERNVHAESIYSTFKSGYQKYETETAGGRNDVHTKRNFRTTIKSIQKELQKVCPFIASGHSIEITRWQVGNTSQDWRYDGDTFIIIVRKEGGVWQPYQGQSGGGGLNFPNSGTAYNLKITPQRNARRWTPIVMQCYVDYITGILKFMDGDGNLIASIHQLDSCPVEVDIVGVADGIPENADITLDTTQPNPYEPDNVEDFYPIFKPERVTFEYPLSYADWKILKAAPTGLIGFQCGDGATEYGWIDEISYKPVEGMAEFVLIPKQPELIQPQYG